MGQSEIEVADSTTLQDILDDLEIHRRVVISVNDVHETNKSRRLQDGDNVKIFSSISGGWSHKQNSKAEHEYACES